MNAATASLPAPDSPVTSTLASVAATRSAKLTAARIASDNAMISVTILLSKNSFSLQSRSLRSNLIWRDVITLCFAPEPFEIVEASSFVIENVHDQITVIDQNPFRGLIAFDSRRGRAATLELLDDLIANCLDLPAISAGKDHKEIGKAGNAAQIQHRRLQSFLLARRVENELNAIVKLRDIANSRDRARRNRRRLHFRTQRFFF